MNDVIIRKLNPTDLELLREISIQTFVDTFADQNTPENMESYLQTSLSLEKLSSEFNHPESEFYFAELNDEIIGYLKINYGAAQSELLENALEIERIYVRKAFHGKKIAQQLYDKAVAIAVERNTDFIWLGVWEHNARAIAFYQKLGFTAFGEHPFMLGDDKQTDILMKRFLP